MLEKIKKLYEKIREKAQNSPLVNWVVIGVFWEFMLGVGCYIVSDNKLVDTIAIFMISIGGIIMIAIIMCGLLAFGIKLIKKVRQRQERNKYFGHKEKKRSKRIKKNNKDNKKIRIGFYCDGGQFWSTFSDLYDILQKDNECETVILAAPEMYKEKIYHYDALEFLEGKKLPYIKLYDDGKWQSFKELKLDYCFYNRHYLSRQSKNSSFLKAREYCRICYIPYAICPQVGDVENTLCRFEELRAFDYMFSENDIMTKIYNKYKNKFENVITKIETAGSPKFAYALENASSKPTHNSKYIQSILYTPRWSFSENSNSFFEMKDYFFELASKNENIEYIFRPHPLMKQEVEKHLGIEFWNELMNKFDEYDNAYVDLENDYMESFSKASVLVSDISTMMFEYSVTGKPVIYMYKVDKLNEFGKAASKGYYYCYNANDVNTVLEKLRNGIDELAEIRQTISENMYIYGSKKPSENILEIIKNDHRNR